MGTSKLSRIIIFALAGIFVLAGILLFPLAPKIDAAPPPVPDSPVITSITFSGRLAQEATGSDNWPLTWADDDNLYTAYGDGWGFDPKISTKLSLGFVKVNGGPTNFAGTNIRSPMGEDTGGGASGKKASGMLMVDGTLYMWVRNANKNGRQCQLAWSTDYAKTWQWSDWKFTELGYCAFLNFGKNYAGSRDNYVYVYSPNTDHAYNESNETVLTRVPENSIKNRNAYEFFSGTPNSPQWSSNISNRKSILTYPGGMNRLDVTYNPGINRYLMTNRSRAQAAGENQLSIFDAPEPWGPWTLVYYDPNAGTGNRGWGEVAHIPSKWISSDGKTFYIVYAGDDSFSVKRAVITTGSTTQTPAPTSTSTPTSSGISRK